MRSVRRGFDDDDDRILRRFIAGKTVDQIAEETGIPLGTVKTRLERARHVLNATNGPQLAAKFQAMLDERQDDRRWTG